VPPYFPLEFRIVAISRSTTDAVTNFCRRDYYDAWLIDYGEVEDIVSFFFVKCATQADLEHFRAAIDAMFANAPDETKTQDEKTFMNEFISQQFNLPRNLTILAWVTIFVAVMAAANTMSMNFRDRLGEFASLRAIGLGGRMILGLIQSESLLTCAVGGAVGALTPYIAFNHTPLREFPVPLILHLPVEAAICAEAMLISLVIGVAAALWPSWMAVKLKVIVALRSLE